MDWIWGFAIAIVAGGVAAAVCVRGGRRARRRDRNTLEASHREVLESRDVSLARQSAELERLSQRLADNIEGALASAQAFETEKKRSNQLANQLDQIAGQLEAERADAAAQLRGAQDAQKVAEEQAERLGRALDEIHRIVDAAKVSLGEAGTALDQIRISAGDAGNGGKAVAWPELAADASKPH